MCIPQALTNIDVTDTGDVTISGFDDEAILQAEKRIATLCVDDGGAGRGGPRGGGGGKPAYEGPLPEAGSTHGGVVVSVKNFGAFVALDAPFAGLEGLVHISELDTSRVSNIDNFVKEGNRFSVKVLTVDPDTRKLSLSRKAALVDLEKANKTAAPAV